MPLSCGESAFCCQEHDPFLLRLLTLRLRLQPPGPARGCASVRFCSEGLPVCCRRSSGAVDGNGHALVFSVSIPFMQISQMLLSRLRRLAGLWLRSASVLLANVHQSSNMQIKNQEFEIKEVQLADDEASHRACVPAFPVNDGILLAITSLYYMLISFQILAFWHCAGFQ